MSTEKKYSLLIPCDDAQHFCDKSQYKEATLVEKIKLSVHLVFCRACQKYSAKNSKLTELMSKNDTQHFNNQEKNELEKLFQEQIKQSGQ